MSLGSEWWQAGGSRSQVAQDRVAVHRQSPWLMALCLLTPRPTIPESSGSLDLSHSMPSYITIFQMGTAESARDGCFHPQEVILCVSCDTVISILLKILLSPLLWQDSRDTISFYNTYSNVWLFKFSLPPQAANHGGPKDNPSILRTSIWRMFLYLFSLKISPSFPAYEVLA